MKADYITFQDRGQPVGYLITFRSYGTWTLNIRTNHVHVVISSSSKPEVILRAEGKRNALDARSRMLEQWAHAVGARRQ